METELNPRICSPSERDYVIDRDKHRCRYCGSIQQPFHIDHVYPYSLGGITKVENLVTACQDCNHHKHNKIGVWPKPIGYFDKPHNVYPISLFTSALLSLGIWFVFMGYSTWEHDFMSKLFILVGIIISFVSLGRLVTGK